MMDQVTIRRMHMLDIDSVHRVELQSFSTPWSRAALAAEVLDNDLAWYLVMEDSQRIIGYAGMWIIIDEAHVTNIAIAPDRRGNGLGERLVRALMDSARERGAVSMTLEVRQSNAAARQLYGKLGFSAQGVRRNYYADSGEDALVMWCDLAQKNSRVDAAQG